MSSIFNKQTEKPADAPTAPGASVAPARASEPPARPGISAPADSRAHLDSGTKVSGKLTFEGPVWIDGEVDGEIAAKESVTIGDGAIVTATIRAGSVLVAGKVSGNIHASERIELRSSARVECDLVAPVVVIQEGAQFEGRCSMHPDGARSDRKAAVLPHQERGANGAAVQKPNATAQTTAS